MNDAGGEGEHEDDVRAFRASTAVESFWEVVRMVAAIDEVGFGNCTNQYECSAVCPKSISDDSIAQLNRDYLKISLKKCLTGR